MDTKKVILLTHLNYSKEQSTPSFRWNWLEHITEAASSYEHSVVDAVDHLRLQGGSSDQLDLNSPWAQGQKVQEIFTGDGEYASTGFVYPPASWDKSRWGHYSSMLIEEPWTSYDQAALDTAVNSRVADEQRPSFLSLPAELRNAIYEMAALDWPHKSVYGLLTASKQINAEASPILLHNATFAFDEISCCGLWLRQISRAKVSRLRRLRLPLLAGSEDDVCVLIPMLETLLTDAPCLEHTTFYLNAESTEVFTARTYSRTANGKRVQHDTPSRYVEHMETVVDHLTRLPGIKELRLKGEFSDNRGGWVDYLRSVDVGLVEVDDHMRFMHLSLCISHGSHIEKAKAAMARKQEEWDVCKFVWFDWITTDRGTESRVNWERWRS
jgi:hypothetical protein